MLKDREEQGEQNTKYENEFRRMAVFQQEVEDVLKERVAKCEKTILDLFAEIGKHNEQFSEVEDSEISRDPMLVVSVTKCGGLVLGCIDTSDSKSRRILQHSSRSTRFSYFCTTQISKFQQKNVQFFDRMKMKFHFSIAFFDEFCDFSARF